MTLNEYDKKIRKLLANGTKPEGISERFETEALKDFITAYAIDINARMKPQPDSLPPIRRAPQRPGRGYPGEGMYPADDPNGEFF